LRRTFRNRMLALRFSLGTAPQELADTYHTELHNERND
jgi:hypothetical protein